MSDEETYYMWCENCEKFTAVDPPEKHEHHKVVGIRDDILKDGIKRLVRELRITGRLIEGKK